MQGVKREDVKRDDACLWQISRFTFSIFQYAAVDFPTPSQIALVDV